MKIIIAGGGALGSKLAELCSKEKHDIVVVEKDEKIAEQLGEQLDALVLKGDATDRKILKDAGIEDAGALVAMTSDDKTNLMVCEVAKDFKVNKIVSRVNDTGSEELFMKLGITASINTTTSAVFAFKKALEKSGERVIGLVAGEKVEIFEKVVNKDSKINGKKISDIQNKFVVGAAYRNGDLIEITPETVLQEGDVIVVCVPVEEVKKVGSLF